MWDLYRNTPLNADDVWANRQMPIEQPDVIQKVKSFLESKLSVELICEQAQVQIWPKGSDSALHVHDDFGRGGTDYNSLLYLNDDFEGGEFYTECGLSIKPKTGTLTFFNGAKVKHGVQKVLAGNRFTLIFWWKNTKFL
jgi:predicted 2-oxoglutarate/Fe(II)-dependent dioxygenase YbiX